MIRRNGDAAHQPPIGIVIPVFGHSRLVAEAIHSALNQVYGGAIHIVVVIDGDKDTETLRTVSSFLSTEGRSISAIYRPNGRLPAARNTGVNFLLTRWPALFGILFLDADNRLTEYSVSAYVNALVSDQAAGWAYPDVTFFGLTWGYSGYDVRETAPVYSRLRHLMGNICEAGSMVRREIFDRGIRFDETFTHGYEDWEFWLQCLDNGYYGTRVANAGFLYRRRADSMLADANRVSRDITDAILRKHPHLFDNSSRWSAFAEECRPLLYLRADGSIIALSTSDYMDELSSDDLRGLIFRAFAQFHHAYLPRYVVFPLLYGIDDLSVDMPMLKRIMDAPDPQAIMYIGGNGDLSDTRHASSWFALVPFNSVMADEPALPDRMLTPIVEEIREFAREAATATRQPHASRRYSGPPSFLIDKFLKASTINDAQPLPAPAPTKPNALVIKGSTMEDVDPLMESVERIYNVTLVNALRGEADSLSEISYLGARVIYRSAFSAQDIMSSISVLFERLYVINDVTYLFNIGQWKPYAKEIVLLQSKRFTRDETIAIQSFEHSLAQIVCLKADISALSAMGIPGRKLRTIDDYFGEMESASKAKTELL